MSHLHQKYLIAQGMIGGAVNLVLNAVIGWVLYRSLPTVPLSGSRSISGDIVVTAFLLPLLVCLIVTPLVRAEALKGKIAPLDPPTGTTLVGILPRRLPTRAIVLGGLAAIMVAPLTIWILKVIGITGMGLGQFVIFKAGLAAALGAATTPIVAFRALVDDAIQRAQRPQHAPMNASFSWREKSSNDLPH